MDLSHIRLVDQHAHNVVRAEAAAALPYTAAFTESSDGRVLERHARRSLFYLRSLREIAGLLGCEPSEEAILARREALGLEGLARACFDAAGLEAVLLDDGLMPDQILPLAWHEQFVPVRRVLRLETVAEDLVAGAASFAAFVDAFRAAIDPPPAGVVAFKSIAAYRTGLKIEPAAEGDAAAAFEALRRERGGGRPRLAAKPLVDFLLLEALEVAARRRLPVQLHTGFGDTDLDLRLASPLHLRPLLVDPRYRDAPVVLLHASYPYMREAGYLASVHEQVFVDFGLAVPFLSVSGMRDVVRALLELAPTSKVMYSSDAHLIPELYYLGARRGREALGSVLEGAVGDSDLSPGEAEAAARAILAGTARELYGLPGG